MDYLGKNTYQENSIIISKSWQYKHIPKKYLDLNYDPF